MSDKKIRSIGNWIVNQLNVYHDTDEKHKQTEPTRSLVSMIQHCLLQSSNNAQSMLLPVCVMGMVHFKLNQANLLRETDVFKGGVLYPVSSDNTKGRPRCIKCLKTTPHGGMRSVNKYESLMHDDTKGHLFSLQATTFMMLETKTGSVRSDKTVLNLLEYINQYSGPTGPDMRILLGEDESPMKKSASKKKKTDATEVSSVTSHKKTTTAPFVKSTLNEEEMKWVNILDEATFTGPYAYAKPPTHKWDSETSDGITENAWYNQMLEHLNKQQCGQWLQSQEDETILTLEKAHPTINWRLLRDSVAFQKLDVSQEEITNLRYAKKDDEKADNEARDDGDDDKYDQTSGNDDKGQSDEMIDAVESFDDDDDNLTGGLVADNSSDKEVATAKDSIVRANTRKRTPVSTFQSEQEKELCNDKQKARKRRKKSSSIPGDAKTPPEQTTDVKMSSLKKRSLPDNHNRYRHSRNLSKMMTLVNRLEITNEDAQKRIRTEQVQGLVFNQGITQIAKSIRRLVHAEVSLMQLDIDEIENNSITYSH